MDDRPNKRLAVDSRPLSERVGASEQMKIESGKRTLRSIWAGFAMFGMIGWSVVIPTMLGVMLGLWLDKTFPAPQRSWTLVLMLAGLVAGCANAWRWIADEHRDMHRKG